ncbi:MAG: winged helix-turn-helix domain-containing protein [Candidatus Nanoarchaeia archaeon]|nr:winged helix-turn-helix domain-containing protein [Candidatus Nanoarchaeia archaeon]MDD5741179.1 winged helix-turn-helix domain-containing protein [Candidatus Nanoarchaeia archaeon]
MKKRTRLEVIKDILEIIRENKQVKITHLIYKSNLSNNSIKPYLKDLLENNMIEELVENERKLFKITKKGNEFLEEFNKIRIFSESFGL